MKRARGAGASLCLGSRQLPTVNLWSAFSFLTCGELAGVHVASKGMQAAVERYMTEACESARAGGSGYDPTWGVSRFNTAYSVIRFARRLKRLEVTVHKQDELAVSLLRANRSTLKDFTFDSATVSLQPFVLVSLAGCTGLEKLDLGRLADAAAAKTAIPVLTTGVGRHLRELHVGGFSPSQVSEVLRADFPVLETFTGCPDDWTLLRFPTLTWVNFTNGGTDIEDPVGFAVAVASLPSLSEIHLWLEVEEGVIREERPDLSWTFSKLTVLYNGSLSLCSLPPLRAPLLNKLEGTVTSAVLAELLEGCPVLTQIGDPEDFDIEYMEAIPLLEADALAARIRSSTACKWWETLTSLPLHGPALPAAVATAIGDCWNKLTVLQIPLSQSAPPLLTRFLLEKLPLLEKADLYVVSSDDGGALPPFELAFVPTARLSLPRLDTLATSLADDTTFPGLSLPSLSKLDLQGSLVRCTDFAAIFGAAPALELLHLFRLEDASVAPSDAKFACTQLKLSECPDLTGKHLYHLLRMLPDLTSLYVTNCEQLRPRDVLTVLAGIPSPLAKLGTLTCFEASDSTKLTASQVQRLGHAVLRCCPALRSICVNYDYIQRDKMRP